jgi:putative ABC transport system ATP-binding protein
MSKLISVENLKKTFEIGGADDIEVLKGVDMEVSSGEFISIMGASGSGKSTLLNILSSIEVPTSGTVLINGIDLSVADEKILVDTRRFTTSIIYQDFNLLPYLTTLENVMFPQLLLGKDENSVREKALDLLEKVELREYAQKLPDDLSGGQRQRVGIARALSNNPKVIFADEPTGNLDTKTGETIMQLFRDLVSEGLSIIMVTHNIQLSKKSDKILILKEGLLHREEEVKQEEI